MPQCPICSAELTGSGVRCASCGASLTVADAGLDRSRQLENGRGGAVYFWYRESPNHLQLLSPPTGRPNWSLSYSDPPPLVPGMRGAKLDTLGRLREFYARLPLVEEAKSGEAQAPAREASVQDWNRLFLLAGIEPSRFTPTEALWNPESVTDARAAWTGILAEMPDTPVRVEAAAYRGKVVFFKLIFPWTKPNQFQSRGSSRLFFILFPVALFLGAVLLAWRNYRQKKGDRQGAIRLVVFLFVGQMLHWLLTASHLPTIDELGLLGQAARRSLFSSAIVWALYIALEPYVRRRWPTSLITWSRVVAGKITDPLVGRDLLIGILLRALLCAAFSTAHTDLRAAGATVYCTGRSTRAQRSEVNRPETIEETAAMVTQAGEQSGHSRRS